jgi:hypothetical protein
MEELKMKNQTQIFLNMMNVRQYADNEIKLKNKDGKIVLICFDGTWSLREFQENKKWYWMPVIFESKDIIEFCWNMNERQFIEMLK